LDPKLVGFAKASQAPTTAGGFVTPFTPLAYELSRINCWLPHSLHTFQGSYPLVWV